MDLKARVRQIWHDPNYRELKLQTIIMIVLVALFLVMIAIAFVVGR